MKINPKEMYESFEHGHVQAFANVLMLMKYGCNVRDVFQNIGQDTIVFSEFIMDLCEQADKEKMNSGEFVAYLSTEDGTLIDMDKIYSLFVAYQYAEEHKLVELRKELLPKEVQEYIASFNESRKQ